MNKIIIIAVFIFWAAISIFYAKSLFAPNTTNKQLNNNANTTNNSGGKSTLGQELAIHNKPSDCWLAINGKIYNVGSYITQHPGGSQEIIKYCGQDATKAFASKDKFIPQDHSSAAYAMLDSYYIGDLNSVAATNTNTQNNNTPTNTNQNTNSNTNTNTPPASYTLTTAIVAQHNKANDCWVTVGSNVYNVTSYIRSHPGGQANITRYCGADIGAAYTAQGHSANASNIFANYKIGTIGTSISADTTTTPPPPVNTNQNTNRDDGEEEDD